MSSRFTEILEKLISRENKEKIKQNLINPLLAEVFRELRPYFFCAVALYVSLILPLILITALLCMKRS